MKGIMKNKKAEAGVIVPALLVLLFTMGCSKAWDTIDVPVDNSAPPEARGSAGVSNRKAAPPRDSSVIEIKEKLFIAQVNDVYLNTGDYLGRTIKVEGIFKQEAYSDREEPYRFVIRYGPGCCAYDGNVGFEIAWANKEALSYPEVDSWVEAVGVVKTYEENEGFQYVYLDLHSLEVLNTRGAEIVTP